MSLGNVSLLQISKEVSNVFSNSNMRYFQHKKGVDNTGFTGSGTIGASAYNSYVGPDRFALAIGGGPNINDGFNRSTDVPDARFEYSLESRRSHGGAFESGMQVQKVESVFARRLSANGKASFSIMAKPILDTAKITMSLYWAGGKDNWGAGTVLISTKTFLVGADFSVNVWDEFKFENVTVPFNGKNGLMLEIRSFNDDATFPQVSGLRTTGWQGNAGPKVLPWSMMFGNEITELPFLQRYYEKSYHHDVDPASATLSGAIGVTMQAAIGAVTSSVFFKSGKRALPLVNMYNPNDGTIGEWWAENLAPVDLLGSVSNGGLGSFRIWPNTSVIGQHIHTHWTALSEI